MSKNYNGERLRFGHQGESRSGKSEIWFAYSNETGEPIGSIHWSAKKRGYEFIPRIHTVATPAEQAELQEFCTARTQEHDAAIHGTTQPIPDDGSVMRG